MNGGAQHGLAVALEDPLAPGESGRHELDDVRSHVPFEARVGEQGVHHAAWRLAEVGEGHVAGPLAPEADGDLPLGAQVPDRDRLVVEEDALQRPAAVGVPGWDEEDVHGSESPGSVQGLSTITASRGRLGRHSGRSLSRGRGGSRPTAELADERARIDTRSGNVKARSPADRAIVPRALGEPGARETRAAALAGEGGRRKTSRGRSGGSAQRSTAARVVSERAPLG